MDFRIGVGRKIFGFPPGIPGLVDVLGGLSAALPGIEILSVDIYSKFVQRVTAPLATEPQNATDTCVTPDAPPDSSKRPDNYVFWDGIHPTKKTQRLIGAEAAAALGNSKAERMNG
jgi:phospholipase/lecithinase/hemolysin